MNGAEDDVFAEGQDELEELDVLEDTTEDEDLKALEGDVPEDAADADTEESAE